MERPRFLVTAPPLNEFLRASPAQAARTPASAAQRSATIALPGLAATRALPRATSVPRASSGWMSRRWRRLITAITAYVPMQGFTAQRTPPSRRSSSTQATGASPAGRGRSGRARAATSRHDVREVQALNLPRRGGGCCGGLCGLLSQALRQTETSTAASSTWAQSNAIPFPLSYFINEGVTA